MAKIISAKDACSLIKSGMTLFVGGFLKCGTPTEVIKEILKTDTKDLTLVGNDTSFVDSDRGSLVSAKKVKKVIASHIGLNPETGRQMNAGEMEVELVPQGTLSERIRSAGAGLGDGAICLPAAAATAARYGFWSGLRLYRCADPLGIVPGQK